MCFDLKVLFKKFFKEINMFLWAHEIWTLSTVSTVTIGKLGINKLYPTLVNVAYENRSTSKFQLLVVENLNISLICLSFQIMHVFLSVFQCLSQIDLISQDRILKRLSLQLFISFLMDSEKRNLLNIILSFLFIYQPSFSVAASLLTSRAPSRRK